METELVSIHLPHFDEWWSEYLDDCDFSVNRQYKWLDKIYRIPIVGQRYVGSSVESLTAPVTLRLVDDNPVDPDAVAVDYCGQRIGWIPQRDNHIVRSNWGCFLQEDDVWDNLPKVVTSKDLFVYFLGIHG